MKNYFFLGFLFVSLFCSNCGQETQQAEHSGLDTTQVAAPDAELEETDLLLGTWELKEKQLPDLGEIPLSGDFYTFKPALELEISHPNDPDLETESVKYFRNQGILSFNDTDYSIEFISGDSMILRTEIDGIEELSIYLKKPSDDLK